MPHVEIETREGIAHLTLKRPSVNAMNGELLAELEKAFDELRTMDKDMYNNVLKLKRYEGNVEDLCLFFEIETEVFGSKMKLRRSQGRYRLSFSRQS